MWEINLYFGGCVSIKGMFDKKNFEIISYIGTKKRKSLVKWGFGGMRSGVGIFCGGGKCLSGRVS